MTITAQLLAGIAGIVLSLGFEYIPKFHDWYNALVDTTQRLLMLGVLLLVSAAIYGLSCAGYLSWIAPSLELTCDQQGLAGLVVAFVSCLVANQSTYLISPKR